MFKLALPRYPLPTLPRAQMPPPPPVSQEFVLGSNSTPPSDATEHGRTAFIARRNDSAQLTPEITSGEAHEEKRIRDTRQYVYKCRYNCPGTLASKVTLRKHMEGTHHLFAEGTTPKRCNICERLFSSQSELQHHGPSELPERTLNMTAYAYQITNQEDDVCKASPATRAKWDVPPPVTQQEKADTWALTKDGTPSAAVRIPNPAYTPPAAGEASETVQTPAGKSRKRKAMVPDAHESSLPTPADQEHGMPPERLSSGHQRGELPERPSSAASVAELWSRPVKRAKTISPPAVAPNTNGFPLKGMGLHDVRSNADGQLWISDRRPMPEHFWQRIGPGEDAPWQPGQNDTLYGTDAELARKRNQSLLDCGFPARSGKEPLARFIDFRNAPMDTGLPAEVMRSMLETEKKYAEHDAMVLIAAQQLTAARQLKQQTAARQLHATQQYPAVQVQRRLCTHRNAARQPENNTQRASAMPQAYHRPSIYNSMPTAQRYDAVQGPQHIQQTFNPYAVHHHEQHMAPAVQRSAPSNDSWSMYGAQMTATPPVYGAGHETMNHGLQPYHLPSQGQGQYCAQSSFDSGYGSMSSLSSAAVGSFRSFHTGAATPYYGG